MNDLQLALSWVFPEWWIAGCWLGLWSVIYWYHFLANNQTIPNKQNNARKYALICGLFAVFSVIAQVANSQSERIWHPVVIALFLWCLLEVADWASYLSHLSKVHPGGLQGLFWHTMIDTFTYHLIHAKMKYTQSLDPAEKQLYTSIFQSRPIGVAQLEPIPEPVPDGDPIPAKRVRTKRAPAHRKKS